MTLLSHMTKKLLVTVVLLITLCAAPAWAGGEEKSATYGINHVGCEEGAAGAWTCSVQGDARPTYTMYELFSPHRLIIDIAQGAFSSSMDLPMEPSGGPVKIIKGEVLADRAPAIARLEFHLAAENAYTVSSNGNDILVHFEKAAAKEVGAAEAAEKAPGKTAILDVLVSRVGGKSEVMLKATGPIRSYQSTEQEKRQGVPARLIIDIADVTTQGHAVPGGDDSPVALVRTEKAGKGARVVLDAAGDELFRYSIVGKEDGLLIKVEAAAVDSSSVVSHITGVAPAQEEASAAGVVADPAVEQSKATVTTAPDTATDDEMAFAGYTRQRISVDFYKIDLHNVFRLIGEISGRNIVVAEGVSGSLTLSLNNVPWDFVLDVILNLKGLAKEERFNTIVISQKSDEFSWPEPSGGEVKLAIKEQEAISVTKRMDVPRQQLEARKVVRQAREFEDAENYAGAITLYEKALLSWPDNGELAKRIANIALVRLGLNAKAAHYGKIAAKLLPEDKIVALQTALALANMESVHEAREYFDVAVSGEKPTRNALASYAAFSEKNGSYDMALSLLERFEIQYGTSLETMVSKARIFDAMGDSAQATEQYRMILLSGYEVPADLKQYITQRIQ